MESSQIIFKGPPVNFTVEEKSFGEFIYEQLKSLPQEKISHIHAETGEEMSNSKFLEESEKVACGLEALNLSVGDVVALFGENSHNISVTITACTFINVTFAPLDPNLTPYELGNILKSYKPKCVFCKEKAAKKVLDALKSLQIKVPFILLDQQVSTDPNFFGFEEVLRHGPKPTKQHIVKDFQKEVAFILPSSGSTGPPKGVAMSHKTGVYIITKTLLSPMFACTFLQTSHLFWISGVFSLIFTYLGGTRIFIDKIEINNVLEAIKKYKVDMAILSPSHLSALIKIPAISSNDLGPIKAILTGGGPLQKSVADQFQFYALTENCGNVTSLSPKSDVMSVGTIEIGTDVKIVDLETELTLAEEKVGEIRVKNDYQMLGYVGNLEATKDSFDNQGWLKTGDLGYMKNGLMYLTGRIKSQIKYRNMQISPSEIEDLLIGLNGIDDVGIEGVPHEEDQYHPIALIVKSPNSSITAEDIHAHVEEHLSAHKKLRGGVIFVDAIPKTTHLKIKRNELRALAIKLHSKSIKPN